MIRWIRNWLHRTFGSDPRYHQQAQEVTNRSLRVERLSKELELYRRGKQ